MPCRFQTACVFAILTVSSLAPVHAELQPQPQAQPPTLENTPATNQQHSPPPQQKLARIWANEPPLVRLARDKFGAEFTETDAKFFAAVAANDWADFRLSPDAKYDPEEPSSWSESATIKADRIAWLCSEPSASRLVPSRGVWLRGVQIEGKIDLYRCSVPFSLTFYDCLLDNGINIRNAKLQELDISNCCSARIDARGVQVAENVYLLKSTVFGGLDFIEAQIAGDLDMNGGLAFHGMSAEDVKRPGVAINLYDAKIDGDVKLGEKFRAFGKVRLNGTRIGRSLACATGQFLGIGETAIDADRAQVGRNVTLSSGFRAEGGVDIRRAHIGGDLDCDGGRFIASDFAALNADLVDIAGQVHLGDGLHAEGEVRFVNALIGKDADCDNGHFLNAGGNALSFDSAVIGRSLRIGYDPSAATDTESDLPAGFLARGTLRLYGTQINQDLLASGGQFEVPEETAILACNLRVASRVVLSGVQIKGQLNLSAADIEHELDLSGSQFDGRQAFNRIAIWANGMKVRGHVYCNQIDAPDQTWPFRVEGLMSFQFVTIGMHWNLYGAQLFNADGDALDASDCRVGGYVNLDHVAIDGRASFSRAKIDGMWILNQMIQPERMRLDMRFAHVWVIKDERLDDWPPAGQLQLEGLVYDHFDDDSPLSVEDRLAWLRRQYAPIEVPQARRGAPDAAETAGRRSPTVRGQETRAQHPQTRAQRDPVVPVDFQMPAGISPPPQMMPPAPTIAPTQQMPGPPSPTPVPMMPMPIPQLPEERERYTREETLQPEAEQYSGSGPTEMAATSEDAAAVDDDSANSDATTTAAATPDPAGRRYITQPYTQLASVYRAIGQDEQANAVLVARAERLGELSPAFSAEGLWYRYLGRLIGYGYEPFRAIKIGVVIVAIGTVIFALGAHRNLMAETKLAEHVLSQEGEPRLVSPTYPHFNPFVYSLDVFLPFVDLHQICYWIPGERLTKPRTSCNCLVHIGPYSMKWSAMLRGYLWFQTLAGWTLCTLLAAAVTGIVQS